MQKQVVVIGGGTSFETYQDYLNYLRNKRLDLNYLRGEKDWKSNLREDLGKNYDVLCAPMPNKRNAKYEEWKIWFEKILKLTNHELVLIGHSLGGMFLAKYLSENNVDKKILLTVLVAAPYEDRIGGEYLKSFSLPKSLELFSRQSENIYLIHSKDDPVVPYKQVHEYERKLDNSKIKAFDNKGHFNQPHFEEIADIINTL